MIKGWTLLNNVSKTEKITFLTSLNAFVFHIIHEDIFVYIDINITMNRLGNRYASTTASFLSIYLLLTNWQNKKLQRPKGFMLMNALSARGSSLTFVQADFLSLLFLNWHTQLNQHWKERHMILIFDSHYKSLSFQYIRFIRLLIYMRIATVLRTI